MSFDKSGKNTGSRRRARECALQMLFAADVVGAKEFSTQRYWAELGFEEAHKGAGSLDLEYREELDKLSTFSEGFRNWLKKADPLERTRKRSEWTRGFTSSIESHRRAFVELVNDLVNDREPSTDAIIASSEKARAEFESLAADLQARIISGIPRPTSDDRAHFNDLRSQTNQALSRLRDELTASFTQLITAVGAIRPFANKLVDGTLSNLPTIDDRIRTRAEHWRIERMAIVDRNVLRLAVYEFLYEDTPHTVVINEGLEIARRFSTFEATQFINGILDAIKLDLEKESGAAPESKKKSHSSSST